MKVRIKRLNELAKLPKYAHDSDAGMDLYATSIDYEKGNLVYGTGIAVEIPNGYVGLVFPRSSISKTSLFLTNAVGVIDSGYRGEITFKFKSSIRLFNRLGGLYARLFNRKIKYSYRVGNVFEDAYKVGDRIGQLIILPYPKIEFEEADELSGTERGVNGYGSTGK